MHSITIFEQPITGEPLQPHDFDVVSLASDIDGCEYGAPLPSPTEPLPFRMGEFFVNDCRASCVSEIWSAAESESGAVWLECAGSVIGTDSDDDCSDETRQSEMSINSLLEDLIETDGENEISTSSSLPSSPSPGLRKRIINVAQLSSFYSGGAENCSNDFTQPETQIRGRGTSVVLWDYEHEIRIGVGEDEDAIAKVVDAVKQVCIDISIAAVSVVSAMSMCFAGVYDNGVDELNDEEERSL